MICFFGTITGLITLLVIPLHLLFGWMLHASRMLPGFFGQWQQSLIPAACLALALWLVHRFIRWWLAARGSSLEWKPGHSMVVTALLLSGSAAAIAMSGVVHQAVWLADGSWFQQGPSGYRRTVALSNAKQILLGLHDFQEKHGRYPDSLGQLEWDPVAKEQLIRLDAGGHGLKEEFLLLRPGALADQVGDGPVILSPFIADAGKFAVGYGDGSAKLLPQEELGQVWATLERRPGDE
ncbi:hypothetical protein [Luteolibacter marinus]|uniref:hypothetical protein n=1 Tax=Luteolibacter marinus TaxID=2776705 RepID=UPI001D005A85|nr:hypothetical protein [Luteolibacter marinus]